MVALLVATMAGPSRAAPGYADSGRITWKPMPHSIDDPTYCRGPRFVMGHVAADSKGAIYVSSQQQIWRIAKDGRLASMYFQPIYPATQDVILAIGPHDEIYVCDGDRNLVERLNDNGTLTLIAGQDRHSGHQDGRGAGATFGLITALTVDADGVLYVADGGLVRKVTPEGIVTTLAGSHPIEIGDRYDDRQPHNGRGRAAEFAGIGGIAVSRGGDVFVTDTDGRDYVIKKIDRSGLVTTFAGAKHGHGPFGQLRAIAVDPEGTLVVTEDDRDAGSLRLRTVDQAGRVGTRFDRAHPPGRFDVHHSGIDSFVDFALGPQGDAYVTDWTAAAVHRIDARGQVFMTCWMESATEPASAPTGSR
jgi:hypothetical protein